MALNVPVRAADGQPGTIQLDANGRVPVTTGAAGGSAVEIEQALPNACHVSAHLHVEDADVEADNPVPVQEQGRWTVSSQADESADDSDKTFVVPATAEWQVLWVWVEYTASGDAGDRQLVVQIQDAAADVIGEIRAGATQAASEARNYLFAPGMADLTAMRDTDYLMTPIPPTLILGPGQIVRVYDNNAVAAAADDMVVQMQVAARTTI